MKFWFIVVSILFVFILRVGMVRLSLAQTTQDGVVNKDNPSSDTTMSAGLFGIGGILESLNSNSGFLTLIAIIVTIVGIIATIVGIIITLVYRRHTGPSDPDVSGTSAGFAKALENRQSKEYLKFDEEMWKVEHDSEELPIAKAIARAYRLQKEEKIEEAIQEWRNIAKESEREDKYLTARAWYSIGYLLDMKDRGEEALSAYSKAINLDENYAAAYFNRGNTRRKLGKYEFDKGNMDLAFEHYEFAIADYSDAIQLKQNFALAYFERGSVKIMLDQHEGAGMDFSKAIHFAPKLTCAYMDRAEVERHFKRHESAIANYNKAIRLEPDNPLIYNNRGNIKTAFGQHEFGQKDMKPALNQYESALLDYNKAISLNPDLALPYHNRGNLKQLLAEYESFHGNRRMALNQNESALLDYNKAIQLDQNNVAIYLARGNLQVDLGNAEEGREDFQTALDLARKQNNADLEIKVEAQILRLDNRK
jgi:tetratricopeptide (TPR) repeat protein